MKYIVAVRYVKREDESKNWWEEKLNTRIFEFNSQKERSSFIKKVRPLVKEFALSQIEEESK